MGIALLTNRTRVQVKGFQARLALVVCVDIACGATLVWKSTLSASVGAQQVARIALQALRGILCIILRAVKDRPIRAAAIALELKSALTDLTKIFTIQVALKAIRQSRGTGNAAVVLQYEIRITYFAIYSVVFIQEAISYLKGAVNTLAV